MATNTVYHPTFSDVTRQVSTEAEREAHKAAGWRMSPLGEPAPEDGPVGEPEAKRNRKRK